ncbi:nif-specific transcriptional activator NifA [Desulfofustis glycolicus]|uniref:Nif-specific regulatory protein n=1 Tax=Desulfofustis glycolicus DSM 9705 TaxID=1121409 RepID=A0A1M5XUH3_9BACT|nr:nif-specific transcriptional activator NifA [Desulfofustis glycolicus]MCB2217209.1 nif-specific transcriptional activator NifA [Desulfobulbaceae bacterium]SHI03372.1 Nif-specific regulatory protein [Desulfofustis glycolicus DSM 9705]
MQSNPKGAAPGTHGIQHLELLALYNITKLIGNAVDLDTTLDSILAVLNDTLKMERATLLLYDRLSERLTIKASCGLSNEEEQRGVYRPDEGVCGQIFQTRSPFVVPDISSEPLFLNRTGARLGLTRSTISFLGVPVIVHDHPEGVLTVDRLFDEDVSFEEDIHFLTILATLIGQFLTLHRAIEKKEKKLIKENETLKARLHAPHGRHSIIGHSKPIQEVFGIINKIAASSATVLLLGESGTGKELVARAIHESGDRRHKAFIKVNCAALPEALLESELFGHERGAFTNAHATRPGRFELADGGTIFLDEIGEMPLTLQVKMLRVLQEKQFERVGGTKTFSVDVRIVAATNASLEREVNRGRFRADLYYRLNVVPIMLPSLRERKEDIPLLFNHFLNKSNERNNRQIRMTADLLDFLIDYPWPGNVREMQNLVERMVILTEDDRLTTADLPSTLTSPDTRLPPTARPAAPASPPSPSSPAGKSLQEIERAEVEAALRRNGWVQVRAARELGLTQRQIGYRIKKYRLSRFDSFRS